MRRVSYWKLDPKANPDCGYCSGTGVVIDWVDYGSTTVPMESVCECVQDDEDEESEDESDD